MSSHSTLCVRAASPSEDTLIADHFYQMWHDNNVPEDLIRPNWQSITLEFIEQARQTLSYQAFVAEVEGRVVGSASCQLFAGLYPLVLSQQYRHDGYIWGVYVEPPYRNRGIAKQLTAQTVDYLRSLGCDRAVLNASPSGKPVYVSLGFTESNAMVLSLH